MNPDTGWDVKIFGSRRHEDFKLIVNMPFLAKDIHSLEEYFSRKKECQDQIARYIHETLGLTPDLMLNATDRNGRPYLTALGSVADTGDVGVVGRGNRLNGLITPMRSMSIEAPAGKNPLDHTGNCMECSHNDWQIKFLRPFKSQQKCISLLQKKHRSTTLMKLPSVLNSGMEMKWIERELKTLS